MPRFATLVVAAGLLIGAVSLPVSAGPTSRTLARALPEMKFDGVGLADAIDFLRDVTAANIHVDWRALEEAGISRDTPVNIRLRNVSLRKVLNMLLNEAGGGDQIGWMVDEGVITITTKERVNSEMHTRIYNVEDLLMEIPQFTNAPSFSLESTSTRGSGSGSGSGGGGGGDGGGEGLFGGGDTDREDEVTPTKEERAEELLTLIKELISPDIWLDNGGTATIRYFNGNIVVRAPRFVHEAIGGSWD